MKLCTKKIVARELLILIGLLVVAFLIYLVSDHGKGERTQLEIYRDQISHLKYDKHLYKKDENISKYQNLIHEEQSRFYKKRHNSIITSIIAVIILRFLILIIQWSIKIIRKQEEQSTIRPPNGIDEEAESNNSTEILPPRPTGDWDTGRKPWDHH